MDDQKADNQQVTRRRDNEPQKTPSPNGRREENAGSFAHPSRRRPDKTIQLSKQHDRSARSSKQLDRLARSSRGPDDKARLEEEPHEMRK